MSRDLLLTFLRGMRDDVPYFGYRPDATGKLGFNSYHKCSTAIRMLSYGVADDLLAEYLRMSGDHLPGGDV
jgi:hypothetical protein